MRPLPFSILYLLCLGMLLGVRFGIAAGAPAVTAKAVANAERAIALPPKPEGLGAQAAPGEGEGTATVLTRARCLSMAVDVREVCLQSLARQLAVGDPTAAMSACAEIVDEDLRLECHADVAEVLAPVDRAAAEAICVPIPRTKWRGQCFFGTGLALAEIDAEYALGRCEQAEAFRDFCRHDVVGEVALVNLEAAVAFCAREEGDTLTRKTCWHGIGKYLARRDIGEAASACGRTSDEWRSNCFHGVGWGAAERDVEATLATCPSYGAYADSCRQGVAHQQKRFDPERAISLCESIGTTSIRERCLAFVKRPAG